jgi:hypothetical protein
MKRLAATHEHSAERLAVRSITGPRYVPIGSGTGAKGSRFSFSVVESFIGLLVQHHNRF